MMATESRLFGVLGGRMAWLAGRQGILAQNIANADTPGYRPLDLREPDFARLVARGDAGTMPMAATNAAHLAPAGGSRGSRGSIPGIRQPQPFETTPSGNAVVLEEQMRKMAANQLDHGLVSGIYRGYVRLFKTALGVGQA